MFGRDKNEGKNEIELEKAPVSFNQSGVVIPKSVTVNAVAKDGKVKSTSTTLIAKDTEIFGDIKFSGSLEIEGHIVGNITANPGSDSSVRILENGQVEGDIQVPKAAVNGDVKGNIRSAVVELAARANIEGNVHYEALEMVKGAQVNGNLVYSVKPENGKPNKKD